MGVLTWRGQRAIYVFTPTFSEPLSWSGLLEKIGDPEDQNIAFVLTELLIQLGGGRYTFSLADNKS